MEKHKIVNSSVAATRLKSAVVTVSVLQLTLALLDYMLMDLFEFTTTTQNIILLIQSHPTDTMQQ